MIVLQHPKRPIDPRTFCDEHYVYRHIWWRFWQRISHDEVKDLWRTYQGPWDNA